MWRLEAFSSIAWCIQWLKCWIHAWSDAFFMFSSRGRCAFSFRLFLGATWPEDTACADAGTHAERTRGRALSGEPPSYWKSRSSRWEALEVYFYSYFLYLCNSKSLFCKTQIKKILKLILKGLLKNIDSWQSAKWHSKFHKTFSMAALLSKEASDSNWTMTR